MNRMRNLHMLNVNDKLRLSKRLNMSLFLPHHYYPDVILRLFKNAVTE